MKRNARKAFTALKRMGCPVFENKPGVDGYGEHFFISAEDNGGDAHIDATEDILWADYYEGPRLERYNPDGSGEILWAFGVNTKINRVLKANGLMSEWINAGMLGVYDA